MSTAAKDGMKQIEVTAKDSMKQIEGYFDKKLEFKKEKDFTALRQYLTCKGLDRVRLPLDPS